MDKQQDRMGEESPKILEAAKTVAMVFFSGILISASIWLMGMVIFNSGYIKTGGFIANIGAHVWALIGVGLLLWLGVRFDKIQAQTALRCPNSSSYLRLAFIGTSLLGGAIASTLSFIVSDWHMSSFERTMLANNWATAAGQEFSTQTMVVAIAWFTMTSVFCFLAICDVALSKENYVKIKNWVGDKAKVVDRFLTSILIIVCIVAGYMVGQVIADHYGLLSTEHYLKIANLVAEPPKSGNLDFLKPAISDLMDTSAMYSLISVIVLGWYKVTMRMCKKALS